MDQSSEFKKSNTSKEFLSGGGEMGQLIRTFNWESTPLGSIDQWPQSLRTTLSIIINSKFPMFLWWGDDLIQFYNDAYRPSLGNNGKHPMALGQKGHECWPEIWPVIKPLIDQILSGGDSVWSEDQLVPIYRNGQLEDVYWTFSYSPVNIESGDVGGVLVVCNETTEAVNSRSTILKSQILLTDIIQDLAVRITFLRGPDHIIELVNDTVLQSWGKDRSVIGKPLKDALPEMESQIFLDILAQVYETGIPYVFTESEVKYDFEEFSKYYDIWYKPVFNPDGTVYGIVTTAIDITDKVKSKATIFENEHRFRNVIESAPFPIGVYVGKELRIQLANQTMLDTWGKGNDVVGKLYTEILPELDNQSIFEQLYAVLETGIPFHAKNTRVDLFIDGKLSPYYFNYSFTPLFDLSGEIYGVMNTAADVTDINIANQKTEQSEQRFRSLIAAAPIAIGVFMGRDLKVDTHNQTFIDIVGKGPDIFGKPLRELMPELEAENQPFLQILDNVFSTGVMFETYAAQVKIVQNGIMTYNYYDITYTPLFDSDGEVYAILDIAIDVTESIIAQQKIEENERNLRNTILQAPMAMCILRGSDHFVDIANDRMLELWGKKHNEIVGRKLMDGLRELEGQGFDLLLDHVYETGETYKANDVAVNLPRESGIETVYVDFVYEAFKESDGTISGVMAVATDVTDQMMARIKIQQAEESARLAIESADLGAYEIDLSNDQMLTSDRFNEIWGVGNTAQRPEYTQRVHPDDLAKRVLAHAEALKTGNLHYEARILHDDMSQVWVKVKGKVLYDDNGNPKTLLGVIQDITEQKEFAEELSKQVKERTLELNRSNEDLLHFAHIASHDLKEPVRKIKVFSNMLEEQFGEFLPEKAKLYIAKVQNATDRMFSMIEGILTYSAVNASEQSIEQIDLNQLLSTIELDLEILILQKNAAIIHNDLPTIEGASILIYQLFYNLINNSLKFSKAGVAPSIQIKSKIITRNEVEFAEISLADNGIGIDPQNAEQIFTAFTRLNAKDKYEGTGLGLALCKKITDRHHGSISATGIRGEGAVFTILLPLQQPGKNI